MAESRTSADTSKDNPVLPLLGGTAAAVETWSGSLEEINPTKCRKYIRGLFWEKSNPTFALNAELAFRNAICVTILGLPFVIPKGKIEALDQLTDSGFFSTGCVFFCIFNLGTTLGETLSAVVQGFKGCFLAVAHVWLFYGFLPDDLDEEANRIVFWFSLIEGTLFVAGMMLCNFKMPTKIFCCLNFCGWWMAFLKPGDDNFHSPLHANWSWREDVGFRTLATTAIGGLLAITASLLPYPILGRDLAEEDAKNLIIEVPRLWTMMLDHLSLDARNGYSGDRVYRNLSKFDVKRSTFPGYLDASWWEGFGMSHFRLERRKLRLMQTALFESSESLHSLWGAVAQRDWGTDHAEMMTKIKPVADATIKEMGGLLNSCYRGCVTAKIESPHLAEIRRCISALKELDKDLAHTVHEFRAKSGDHASSKDVDQNIALVEQWLLPHVFAFNLSCYVQSVLKFAEALDAGTVDTSTLPVADLVGSPCDLMKGIKSPAHLNFVLRALLSIYSGMGLGYFGYKSLIKPYHSGIATTCTLLLSNFAGSAMVKNLGRVQGVVLGTVTGQIIQTMLDSCSWFNVLPLTLAAFSYSLVTLYVWHAGSADIAFVGCLAGSFGLSAMWTQTCTPAGEHNDLDKEGTYDSIVTNIIACTIIVTMDMIFAPARADTSAVLSLYETFDNMEQALQRHFNDKNEAAEIKELRESVAKAKEVGQHAENEPRGWRIPWKAEAYSYIIERLEHLSFSAVSLQSCMTEGFKKGGTRNALLQDMARTPTFPTFGSFLCKKIRVVKKLATLFEQETATRLQALEDPDVQTEFREEARTAIGKLLQEMADRKHVFLTKDKPSPSMCQDDFAQICTTYGAMQGIMRDLRLMQHRILREC